MLAAIAIVVTAALVIVQCPGLQTDILALGVSLLVCCTVGVGIFLLTHLNGPSRPPGDVLPIFALVVAVHTMMPVSRIISITVGGVLTVSHLILACLLRDKSLPGYLYQVSVIFYFNFILIRYTQKRTLTRREVIFMSHSPSISLMKRCCV